MTDPAATVATCLTVHGQMTASTKKRLPTRTGRGIRVLASEIGTDGVALFGRALAATVSITNEIRKFVARIRRGTTG